MYCREKVVSFHIQSSFELRLALTSFSCVMAFFCSGGPDGGVGLTQTVAVYQRSGEARRWYSDMDGSRCSLTEGVTYVTALAPPE